MSNIRETYESRLGVAWGDICDRAGMIHDGCYNVKTQSPDFTKKLGELIFKYMTDMSDSTDGISTRGVHELALFFEDMNTYDKHRE